MTELLEMPSSLNDACRKLDAAYAEIERLRAIPAKLRADHFAKAHTDMVGDEEHRDGYLEALKDCERALNQQSPSTEKP